jgi:hypothetical protein
MTPKFQTVVPGKVPRPGAASEPLSAQALMIEGAGGLQT